VQKSSLFALVFFYRFQIGGGGVRTVEQAVKTDFQTVRTMLSGSEKLDSLGEPQTDAEVEKWLEEAQKIRAEMLELAGPAVKTELLLSDSLNLKRSSNHRWQ